MLFRSLLLLLAAPLLTGCASVARARESLPAWAGGGEEPSAGSGRASAPREAGPPVPLPPPMGDEAPTDVDGEAPRRADGAIPAPSGPAPVWHLAPSRDAGSGMPAAALRSRHRPGRGRDRRRESADVVARRDPPFRERGRRRGPLRRLAPREGLGGRGVRLRDRQRHRYRRRCDRDHVSLEGAEGRGARQGLERARDRHLSRRQLRGHRPDARADGLAPHAGAPSSDPVLDSAGARDGSRTAQRHQVSREAIFRGAVAAATDPAPPPGRGP